MKNSKEMADAVFRIRDEYLEKKRRRNEAVKRAAVIGVPTFAAFALMIGVGAVFDRQEIIPDGVPEAAMETAPVSAETTVIETTGAPAETNALKDTAEKSTTTKKETMPSTEQVIIEEDLPETMIPDGQSGTPEGIFREETAAQTTTMIVTAAELIGAAPENESEPVFQPDEETDGLPGSTETANAAAYFGVDEFCRRYPTFFAGGEYVCTGETVTEDMLGSVLIEVALDDGFADSAVVYSLENDRIAVKFGRTDFYIVYKAKED
ncbi:MAG: hypothetical protein K6B74_02135 [Ruminococcus sp.]|nr:hypothetical protein [Ruminococcus sp.]